MGACSVDGCDVKSRRGGMCDRHYRAGLKASRRTECSSPGCLRATTDLSDKCHHHTHGTSRVVSTMHDSVLARLWVSKGKRYCQTCNREKARVLRARRSVNA